MNCPSCATVLPPQATLCKTCGRLIEDPLVGTMINERYRIQAKIAVGGFGAIYRATQVMTNRRVAIKVMHREYSNDEQLVARFRREAAAMCSLRDAHTVTTYELAETTDGRMFIVMELLEGRNLFELFRASGRLPWRRVLMIAHSVCSALAEAHSLGIVHRDLKPANIFLEERHGGGEFVKVLDFGIAKIMHGSGIDDGTELTITGQAVGTLEYMAPEQLIGGRCDGRTDIYTLGLVIYEMIVGRRPFAAIASADLLTAQLSEKPAPPSSFPVIPAVPPGVDRIVLCCLARDASDRFPDVGALAAAIDELFAQIDHAAQTRTSTAPGMGVTRNLATPPGGTRASAPALPQSGLAGGGSGSHRLPPPGSGEHQTRAASEPRPTAPSGLAGVTAPMSTSDAPPPPASFNLLDSAESVTTQTAAVVPDTPTPMELPQPRLLVGGAAAAASRIDVARLGEEETAVGAPPTSPASPTDSTVATLRKPPAPRARSVPDAAVDAVDTFRDAAVPIPKPALPVTQQPPLPTLHVPRPSPVLGQEDRLSVSRAVLWLIALLALGVGAGIVIARFAG